MANAFNLRRRQAKRDYRTSARRAKNIYGSLHRELSGVMPAYDAQAKQISSDLQGQLGGLSSLLSGTSGQELGGAAAQEAAAGRGVVGATGEGMLGLLASGRQRGLEYGASTARQAGIEKTLAHRSFLEQLQAQLDEIEAQRAEYAMSRRGGGSGGSSPLDALMAQLLGDQYQQQASAQKQQQQALEGWLTQQYQQVPAWEAQRRLRESQGGYI